MSSDVLRVLQSDAELAAVADAVRDALAGGRPIAPLPADPTAADQVLAMLRPEVPLAEPDAAVVVSTSGSTGAPKGVVLSRSAIRASAAATEDRLGGPGRWLLALPTHYVAGFMVVARAVAAGRPVHRVGRDLSGLTAALDAGDGRSYLSVVATQLTRALRDPALTTALAGVDVVLLGGGPADADLLTRAREAGITIVTTYGMSETCGGCVYDGIPLPGATITLDPTPQLAEGSPNPSFSRRVATPQSGEGSPNPSFSPRVAPPQSGEGSPNPSFLPRVARDHTGTTEGRILLGGPMVFSGYRLRPDLTAATLLDGLVRTNDRGVLADGRLQILGRYDDVIISGGLKIDTAALERTARQWPDLDGEIAVVGVPDPEWGTRPVAYAESWSGDLDADSLRSFLETRVARHELPELVVLPNLPRTSSGKIDREALRQAHGSGVRAQGSGATHRKNEGLSDPSPDWGAATHRKNEGLSDPSLDWGVATHRKNEGFGDPSASLGVGL